MLHCDIWNHLTVCKQMSFDSFKNVTYELSVYKSYIYLIYVETKFGIK